MTLDDIMNMWKTDSNIDDLALDDETKKTSKLHSKYLELVNVTRLQLAKLDSDLDKLKKDKWLYYTGKMTKEQMDMKGWAYDPFGGGTKPLKSELDYYYDSDEDIVRIKQRIEYQKAIANTLEEIMNNLRWRHTHIKNILDWKKFVSGT
tara:strand:- start:4553 stop:4999 length:447 start_codon:yes stop_codon:yes gene_type:complete